MRACKGENKTDFNSTDIGKQFWNWGRGGTPYNGLYWEAPPERRYPFQTSGLCTLVEVFEGKGNLYHAFRSVKRPERANEQIHFVRVAERIKVEKEF